MRTIQCRKCLRVLGECEFHTRSRSPNGKQPICKACVRSYQKKYKNSPAGKKACEEWCKSERGRSILRVCAKRYYWKHRDRELARCRVYDHRSRENIVKPGQCSRCGSPDKVQAHHSDYAKPLDIKWLCHSCHCKEHGKSSACG